MVCVCERGHRGSYMVVQARKILVMFDGVIFWMGFQGQGETD